MNIASACLKRTRSALAALSLVASFALGAGGFSGCVVEGDKDDATGGRRDRTPGDPEAGDASVGGATQAGANGDAGSGAAENGGEANGQGGANDAGSPATGGRDATGGNGAANGGANDAGAGGDSGTSGGTGSGVLGAEPGTWTYLVYMLADNDLERFALQDLEELMQVGSGEKLTILAQVDRAVGEADDDIGGLGNFTSTKRVRVDPGSLTELADIGEVNMGQSSTLSEFLEWGISQAPAQHYAVIFWDHGSAWPQFGADFSHGFDGLTLAELTSGVDAGAGAGGLLGPLDLVGFDACLMATWEVAVAFQNRARYLLASEEVEPGHGWDHREISLLRNGGEAQALGEALLSGYRDQASQANTLARVTLSLTDLGKVSAVTNAIGTLTQALRTDIASHAVAIGKARAEAPTFGEIPGGQSSQMTDLAVWADALASYDPGVAPEAQAIRTALESAVIEQVTGSAQTGMGGLSIYFPAQRSGYTASYDAVSGVESWRDFVDAFYDAAAQVGSSPEFTNADKLASVTDDGDSLLVEGQLAEGSFANLTSALFSFGLVVEDIAFFFGEEQASVSSTGNVSATWDKSALLLSQGDVSDFGFYSIEATSADVFTLSVPFEYHEGADAALVVLLLAFDSNGDVLSQGFYGAVDGSWSELVASEGSTLVPILPALEPNSSELTWVPLTEPFDATLAIDLEFITLDPGTEVLVQLTASDFAGEGDAVTALGTL